MEKILNERLRELNALLHKQLNADEDIFKTAIRIQEVLYLLDSIK
jgi:hypothetical protein